MDERADETTGRGTMQPGGAYAAHPAPQRSASGPGLEMLARAVERVPLPPDGLPLVVADTRAAQGRSEMAPLSLVVRTLRPRSSAPIVVIHTDLPGNDWGSLFSTVEEAGDSYLRAAAGVYPAAVGRSFLGRLVPGTSSRSRAPTRRSGSWSTSRRRCRTSSSPASPSTVTRGTRRRGDRVRAGVHRALAPVRGRPRPERGRSDPDRRPARRRRTRPRGRGP